MYNRDLNGFFAIPPRAGGFTSTKFLVLQNSPENILLSQIFLLPS